MRDDRRKVSPTAGPSTAERRVGPTDRRRGTPPTGLDRGRSSGLEAYVGGPPLEYPDRYELASPSRLMRANLPPTLLIAAGNDHLVRLPRVQSIADALKAAGAETAC